MKNLNEVLEQCKADCDKLGIKYNQNITLKTITQKRVWGLCKRTTSGCIISINEVLLKGETPDNALKNTMMHELLHSVMQQDSVGKWMIANGHTGFWARLAKRVNNANLGYNIKRCTSYEEKGIADTRPKPKYTLRCTVCGKEYTRRNKSSVITNYKEYRCSCGGKFELLEGEL